MSGSGIAVDPGKTDAVSKWPEPKNKTEVRSFLGLHWFKHHNCLSGRD